MDRDTAKEIILASLPNYLEQKGIRTDKKFICLNPEHVDHTPSMMYDRRRNKCHCFSCGMDANIFDIISWDYCTGSFAESFDIACDLFGLDVDNHEKKEKPKIKPQKNPPQPRKKMTKAAPEVCDKVYRTLKRISPLTEEDIEYLQNTRGLSKDRIQNDYFRIVSEPDKRKRIVNQISKLTGYSKDILKYVPGFFVRKETGELDYSAGKENSDSGIGILIHGADGCVTAVQIRRDTAEKGKRYCWFTSSFAVDNPDFDGGSSPGAAKDVMVPDNPKNCLCITEGRFKAEILAANRNIVISLQGVSTWRGIDEIINQIREAHEIKSIYLMFDSDVMGNSQLMKNLSTMIKSLKEWYPDIHLMSGIWRIQYGKGIDDCILNGNLDKVAFVDAEYFINTCRNSLQEVLKQYNVSKLEKLDSQVKAKLAQILQQKNEEILLYEKTMTAA